MVEEARASATRLETIGALQQKSTRRSSRSIFLRIYAGVPAAVRPVVVTWSGRSGDGDAGSEMASSGVRRGGSVPASDSSSVGVLSDRRCPRSPGAGVCR